MPRNPSRAGMTYAQMRARFSKGRKVRIVSTTEHRTGYLGKTGTLGGFSGRGGWLMVYLDDVGGDDDGHGDSTLAGVRFRPSSLSLLSEEEDEDFDGDERGLGEGPSSRARGDVLHSVLQLTGHKRLRDAAVAMEGQGGSRSARKRGCLPHRAALNISKADMEPVRVTLTVGVRRV
jgi:hypothetical protein